MKNTSAARRLQLVLLAAITVFTLQFHGFAYKPAIITPNIPEAMSGSYYYAQISAEGFGKKTAWSANGLPHGLRIEPDAGVIFGIAENPGVFEVLVTVKSGEKRTMRSESKLFRLTVLPQTAEEPPAYAAPSPQAPLKAEAESSAVSRDSGLAEVEWLGVRANGISGLDTTTVLYLDFSEEIPWPILDFSAAKENIKIVRITGENTEFKVADVDSISKNGATRELYIKNIHESVEDGEEVKVIVELNISGIYQLLPDSMTVRLSIASADFIKATDDINALMTADILGTNTSADALTANLSLPNLGPVHGCAISWQSSDSKVISDSGFVTRPKYSEGDKNVTLTAAISVGARTVSKNFQFTVKSLSEPPPEILPEIRPETSPVIPPGILPGIASSAPQSGSRSGSDRNAKSSDAGARTSSNVDKDGTVSRTAATKELKSAFKASAGKTAVIKTQNAKSISLETLRVLAAAAEEKGKQAVLHADTLTPRGGVDARLYLKPASLLDAAGEIKLGISTEGARPKKTKRIFEKYFNNEISVISCEQQGDFGARLQIAAKVKLPEDTGNLVFYSYDPQNNSFSRIITAYRVDANGYLRFTTYKAGDIIISNGVLSSLPA